MNYMKSKDFELVIKLIGNKIKQKRNNLNLSIVDLSVISGVAESYISQIENAKRINVSLSIYLKLAYYLGITPSSLLEKADDLSPFN